MEELKKTKNKNHPHRIPVPPTILSNSHTPAGGPALRVLPDALAGPGVRALSRTHSNATHRALHRGCAFPPAFTVSCSAEGGVTAPPTHTHTHTHAAHCRPPLAGVLVPLRSPGLQVRDVSFIFGTNAPLWAFEAPPASTRLFDFDLSSWKTLLLQMSGGKSVLCNYT